MTKRKRKFDVIALFIIIVCGFFILIGITSFHPLINIPIRKPIGLWYAKTARAQQKDRNSWYGPLLSPVKREQKLLQAEINVYEHMINNLHSKTNFNNFDGADLIVYKSNLCVATELITNTSALKIYLKANSLDKRESWRPWILRILLFTLIAGGIIGAFIFYFIRFIRGLIGYKTV